MLAEKIRKDLSIELAFCRSSRDIARVFQSVQHAFHANGIPPLRRQQVLGDIKSNLRTLLANEPRLLREAEALLDELIRKNR